MSCDARFGIGAAAGVGGGGRGDRFFDFAALGARVGGLGYGRSAVLYCKLNFRSSQGVATTVGSVKNCVQIELGRAAGSGLTMVYFR